MRTSEGYLRAIARGSQEPLFSVSPSGRIVWWGHVAEAVFGYTRTEAVGRQILALVAHPDSVDLVTEAIARAVRDGAASCVPACKTREGASLPEPLRFRIERRGTGASADLLFLVGLTPASALVEPAAHLPEAAPSRIVPLQGGAPAPEPPPEGMEAAVTQALLASHDASVLLSRVGRAIVPAFADGLVAYLVDTDGHPRAAAVAGTGIADLETPGKAAELGRESERGASLVLDAEGRRILLRLLGRTRPLGCVVLHRQRDAFTEGERAWAETLARRIAVEVENIRLADLAQRAHDEARRAAQRLHHYERLAGALADASNPPQILDAVVQEAGALLGADGGALAILTEDRTALEVVAATPGSEALTNARRDVPVSARVPVAEAARSGQAVVIEYLRAAVSQYEHLSGLPPPALDSAVVAVPLVLKGRSMGALGLRFPTRRSLTAENWTNLQALARHCADALERVRLYDAERRARAEAGEEARRLEILSDASRILAAAASLPSALATLAKRLVPSIADWCAIYGVEEGRAVPLACFHRESAKQADLRTLVEQMPGDAGSPVPLAKVIETSQPVLLFSVPDALLSGLARDTGRIELVRNVGLTSQMMLPIPSPRGTIGVLVVAYGGFRRYSSSDVVLIETLARRIGLAMDNAHLLEQARESEERYRLLVEGVQDHAIFSLDPEGRISTWNAGAQRLYGYRAEEVIGRPHDILYDDAEPRHPPQADRDRARREGRVDTDVSRRRKDGSRFVANVLMTPLYDERGELRGYSVLVRDLTERNRAKEELDRARQRLAAGEKLSALGSLVSGVAHEIRTPLTAMSNNLHLLEFRLKSLARAEPKAAPLLEQVHGAIEGIDRLNRLVEDLRKFARVKAGTRARVSLDAPVLDAVRLFGAAHRGSVQVETRLSPTRPIEVDVLQLQQVILNLLSNAADAMPHGGTVVVETEDASGGARVVVQDTGMGMPREVQARMFEEFYSTKPQGTGLGLSIVRRIVEAHRGTISCRSTPGKGTRFEIFLPDVPL